MPVMSRAPWRLLERGPHSSPSIGSKVIKRRERSSSFGRLCAVTTDVRLPARTRAHEDAENSVTRATPVKARTRGGPEGHEQKGDRERGSTLSAAVPRPDPPGAPPDPERRERILGKLGQVWARVPDWSLAWLIVNLVPPGPGASDAEIEFELDRLLNLDLG